MKEMKFVYVIDEIDEIISSTQHAIKNVLADRHICNTN